MARTRSRRLEQHRGARLVGDRGDPFGAGRGPSAGGSPRTRTGRLGRPESTSAASAALGPGTTSTGSPASRQARTSCAPGSEIPGMPASVTTATRSPAADLVDDALGGGGLVVRVHRAEPPPGGDAGVRQQRAGAAGVLGRDDVRGPQLFDRARRQIAEVADRRADEHERPPPAGRSLLRLRPMSPVLSPQRSNAPASASITNAARGTRGETRHGRRHVVRSTMPSRVAERDVDRGSRMPNVWTCRHGRSTSAPSKPSRPSRPRRRARRVCRDLGRREHVAVAHQPGMPFRFSRQTLKRISSTSPSSTTYSLPSTRSLPSSLAFVPRADLEQLVASRSPRRG